MYGSRKISHREVARAILPQVMRITEGNILPRVISVLLTVILPQVMRITGGNILPRVISVLLTDISQIDSTSINVATAEILLIEILAIFQQL